MSAIPKMPNRSSRRLRRRRLPASSPPSDYVRKFASYGTAFSLSFILVLSVACRTHQHASWMDSIIHSSLKLSLSYKGSPDSGNLMSGYDRNLQQFDGVQSSELSCEDIFIHLPKGEIPDRDVMLCDYARHCVGDPPSTFLLPLILCQDKVEHSRIKWIQYVGLRFFLPTVLLLYLHLLFRLLATTADSYFSPALETLSFELGLPPRFAGATLLALGNGSPDLGSTINSILLWNEPTPSIGASNATNSNTPGGGWTMSLGSLTGGGMFVGTIVSGLIVRSCGGIPCRGAFLRDVSMYALSVIVVWHILESEIVTRRDVRLLLGLWVGYVSLILASDLYHRKVTLRRLHTEGKKRREKRLSLAKAAISDEMKNNSGKHLVVDELTPLVDGFGQEANPKYNASSIESTTELASSFPTDLDEAFSHEQGRRPRLSVGDRFAMLMSNYDPASVKFDMSPRSSTVSNDDSEMETIHNMMCQFHSIRRTSIAFPTEHENNHLHRSHIDASRNDMVEKTYDRLVSFPEEFEDESVINEENERTCSFGMIVEAYQEIVYQARCYWKTCYVDEPSRVERFGFLLEIPFTILRTLTIPVPCEDHYNRFIVALSTAVSPFWIIWYLDKSSSFIVELFCVFVFLIASAVIRFGGDERIHPLAAVPLSLYGFFIAATWIDVIGTCLVHLLQFLGTICRIPPSILGVTVLAWGNSLGDLSANISMARKGMPDMATTANFAGPSFNLLVGTGCGFLALQQKLHTDSISPVSLTHSIRIGFSFIIINCSLIIFCAVCFQWRIPYRYSYVFFALYGMFMVMSLMTIV